MRYSIPSLVLLATLTLGVAAPVAAEDSEGGRLVQYGKMHEAIGQKQDHGRVLLSELVKNPHFYAVGALAGLDGEVTISDGQITVTTVDADGKTEPVESPGHRQATMLAGAYVPEWTQHTVERGIRPSEFDGYLAKKASAIGIDTEKPFVFVIEGDFHDVRVHVINGACPVHARIKSTEISPENQPYESLLPKVTGKVVGVFAKDAVGNLTQPATMTHAHLLFRDEEKGLEMTAHVEQIGLVEGSVLRLPK